MINPRNIIIKPKGRERVHGPPSLGLVPENIPAWWAHGPAPFLRCHRRNNSGVGTKKCCTEKSGVGTGMVLPTISGRIRGRRDVKEREVGSRSAGYEPVGVDGSGRRFVVVGVDHTVDVARWG